MDKPKIVIHKNNAGKWTFRQIPVRTWTGTNWPHPRDVGKAMRWCIEMNEKASSLVPAAEVLEIEFKVSGLLPPEWFGQEVQK